LNPSTNLTENFPLLHYKHEPCRLVDGDEGGLEGKITVGGEGEPSLPSIENFFTTPYYRHGVIRCALYSLQVCDWGFIRRSSDISGLPLHVRPTTAATATATATAASAPSERRS
jgi:hypothetical protein